MDKTFPFDQTYAILNKTLDITARRHSLITGNIANMDTVGYHPKDLDFQKTLEKAMQKGKGRLLRTHPGHLPSRANQQVYQGKPRVDPNHPGRLDTVDIDTEMTNLISNNGKYKTTVEMLLRKIAILRQSISEGGN